MTETFEQRLQMWMNGLPGVTESRRVVRRDGSRVLVSKFDDGFAAHLHEVLDQLPELFDAEIVASVYTSLARAEPSLPRAATWRAAIDQLLIRLAEERHILAFDVTNVRGGLDSVSALLDAVLWSSPLNSDADYTPLPGEVEAYQDVIERMDGEASIFTRVYGMFEGMAVVNHCAAPVFGRLLFVQAWEVCTRPV